MDFSRIENTLKKYKGIEGRNLFVDTYTKMLELEIDKAPCDPFIMTDILYILSECAHIIGRNK